ncbi:M36 family metallopeptidase [uncultured Nocardioides sp.]|uniref:M36 family metallopeptidase n=1 Tax=uncultured Nocardioides sp. TaxID=198441 RepID=UPI00260719DB|nr:M36 family metallopeptidase [uncultured Nocardioides sp.]
MPTAPSRARRRMTAALALMTATLVPGLAQIPALATSPTVASADLQHVVDGVVATLGDTVPGLSDLDLRGRVLPTAAQRSAADRLGAVTLRWNDFGTPGSLLPADGALARATSADPVAAARAYLEDNAALFGLTRAAMAGLELVNEQKLADYPDAKGRPTAPAGHAVLFRQRFGDLSPALGSMVTVGVSRGEIAYVSSSLARTTQTAPAATLTPLEGWVEAAGNVGRSITGTTLRKIGTVVDRAVGSVAPWTRLSVPGFSEQQQVRLRALALADGTVRPVYEANVVDNQDGLAFAYTLMVDAVTGDVLHRAHQVENDSVQEVYQGTFSSTECGPKHAFELTDDLTTTLNAAALALPVDDVVVKFFGPKDRLLYTGDLLTSPEVVTWTSPEPLEAGVYSAQVCPFDDASAVVGAYALIVSTSDTATPGVGGGLGFDPTWSYFPANPSMSSTKIGKTPGNDVIGCWVDTADCSMPTGPFRNLASPFAWDQVNVAGASSMTTIGNNANTHEAWASPLTPGGLLQAPVSPTRTYTGEFTDAWNESACDPTNLVPGGNDIDFVTGNLFVSHNRMHDYSYYLGFTEENYNLQLDNFGRGGVPADAEVGNVQAGALTSPVFEATGVATGRNNANQITLQDGVPGITNQYLFQPAAGAFYAPCTDGSLDMGIVGHEYTHAISNRMIAGPDEGIGSDQGGAMGESWGDLTAAEYQFSHGYKNGGNIFAVGVYATGNKKTAIRNFAINKNPLNYSNYGYDTTGVQVHADGEVWSGTQWEVRQALVEKWNRKFPYKDKALQLDCAQGSDHASPVAPQYCPGNRRWIQLVFDAFLLQQGSTSMLDARDAMLAADRMRFGGENTKVMWQAFARRGMGKNAAIDPTDENVVTGGFASPKGGNATVTFKGGSGPGSVYVGMFEARTSPLADTYPKTRTKATATMTPGRYDLLYVSPKGGFHRFGLTVKAGQKRTVRLPAAVNLAASAAGAKVIGATEGSLKTEALIDGTEDTNWAGVTEANVDDSKPFVAVDLAGKKSKIRRVQVSALLNPVDGADDIDQLSGSRFTALRQFAIEVCTKGCTSGKARWKRVFTSKSDAFPAVRPRPTAPKQVMRSFSFKPTKASAVRLVVLNNQCTGFAGYAGELDNDPITTTDCATGSERGKVVHAAELQVFKK